MTDLCNSKGIEINKVITEVGRGTDAERDGYKEVLRLAREGEMYAVVVEKLENLSRDYNELYPVLEELYEKGIKVCGPGFDYSTQRQKSTIKLSR